MRAPLLLACLSLGCASVSRPGPGPGAPASPARGPSSPGPGETVAGLDLGGDGKPDAWIFSRAGPEGRPIVTRREKDLNGDGRVDSWERLAPDGTLAELSYDMDFDGTPDATLHLEGDRLVRKEYTFGPGRPGAVRSWYEGGVLVRTERDTDGDGKVDTWERWTGGRVDRIGSDLDGDGAPDRWEERGPDGAPGR
ncbi:MAG TPA: hypothetical protein VLS93_14330 [Anaeromyxobacteraceae bacterium]|nr:hypothetical protein [Anaeromyxobacteraceae bacterium]